MHTNDVRKTIEFLHDLHRMVLSIGKLNEKDFVLYEQSCLLWDILISWIDDTCYFHWWHFFFDGKLVVVIHETMAKLITWKSNPNENKDRSAKKNSITKPISNFRPKATKLLMILIIILAHIQQSNRFRILLAL